MIKVRVASIRVNESKEIALPDKGVICVVGGNNVGKSQLLKEVENSFSYGNKNMVKKVVSEVKLYKPTITDADVSEFLNANTIKSIQNEKEIYTLIGDGSTVEKERFKDYYGGPDGFIGLNNFFVKRYGAGYLENIADQQLGVPMGSQVMSGLLMPVYNDSKIEREISDVSELAFNKPLTFDRLISGLRFRVGKLEIDTPKLNSINQRYVNAVSQLPPLNEQGDGVRSFLGLVIAMLLQKQQVMMFDEPEAFLHPPQATILGKWIGQNASKLDKQIFLATHDKNILLGLLESGADITLLRLTREGNVNHLYPLDHEKAKAAWNNPVLRYSNVLQGLFHRQTVICEADADCRFYNAVLDYVAEQAGKNVCADETLFVPAGGKDSVKNFAFILSSLHIKVFAILDFDVLNDKKTIKQIVESVGALWTADMNRLCTDFLKWANGEGSTNKNIWKNLKASGVDAVDRGEPTKVIQELLGLLNKAGVLVVPVGEMECLQRDSVSEKGDFWVRDMLQTGKYKTCEPAIELIKPILDNFK